MATGNGRVRTAYLEGTAARQLSRGFEAEKLPTRKKVSNATRKNREKAHHMNWAYVAFLTIALAFTVLILYNYVGLQSDITNRIKTISVMEKQYNNLKLANDEELGRINGNIDLEQIRAVAIGELGMTYAEEGQMIVIKNSETDYVRQKLDLK